MKAIKDIEARNRRVEADKAWETSKTRRAVIAVFTYAVVVLFLFTIGAEQPFLMGLIPAAGYVLSTLALSPLRHWWQRNIYRNSR